MSRALWRPSDEAVANSQMSRFREYVNQAYGLELAGYDALYAFSIEMPEDFWSAIWDYCALTGDKGQSPYLVNGDDMMQARFFPKARLNYAENLLKRRDDEPALIFRSENGRERSYSRTELYDLVSRLRQAFQAKGLKKGARVAAIMPNLPETIACMLAITSLGAIWSSCSPDFGASGILDRFGQIEPEFLIACDGYFYGGKRRDISGKVQAAAEKLPNLKHTIIVSYEDGGFGDFIAPYEPQEIEFERFAFNHPLYILFSSGTTGKPKCIVHGAGGVLLQHVKEHRLHCDLQENERLFYFTTCGWMMWNWLVSGLASGAALLLYDGSPFYPGGHVLFDFAAERKMNIFGTAAKYIDAVKKAGLEPAQNRDLSALRMMTSTGSPLAPESYDFVYGSIKPDIQLASISGGTDIVSCFVLGNPVLPVWRGEIQGPGLGMAVDIFDADGNHISQGKGELVCTKPFPCQPVSFWNDKLGKKYASAYFSRFNNVWHHGDFAEWTSHKGIIIHGRSDATLNPGGVRIGTAEIYAAVEQMEEVNEAIAIGQNWRDDVRIVLFVILGNDARLDDDLKSRIRAQIRTRASPRHVPAKVIEVTDIPRTKSGKITELAVRDIVHGVEVKNREALANPQALELYRELAELKN